MVECIGPVCHELTCRVESVPVDPALDPHLAGGSWCRVCKPLPTPTMEDIYGDLW